MRKTQFTLLLLCCVLLSCSKQELKTPLSIALELAGENQIELQKVLDRYNKCPQDSLKYKAACFLIENMPYYFYYEGTQIDDYSMFYELLKKEPQWEPNVILDTLALRYGGFSLSNLSIRYDINEIDSAYLCNNIEWSFKVWQEQPWMKNVSFSDFCEYILPYRLGNEKISYWKEEYYNRYCTLLKDIHQYNDADDPVRAVKLVTDSLKKMSYRFTMTAPTGFPSIGPKNVQHLSGSCRDITDFTLYVCRALGIPCSLDYITLRGDENGGHFWVAYHDKYENLYIQDFLGEVMAVRDSHLIKFNIVKAYRKTFGQDKKRQKELSKLPKDNIYPAFFSTNQKDVTIHYADYTSKEVLIPDSLFYNKKDISSITFLCLSSRMQWVPIDWAVIEKNNLCFKNIGLGGTMRIATWENNNLVFQTPPFTLSSPWGTITIHKETEKKQDIVILSKTHLKTDQEFLDRMVGGVFEGSNDIDFQNKDTLHQIYNSPQRLLTVVNLDSIKKTYRYVRYFGGRDSFCNVSEIAFYGGENDTCKLAGKIIGTPGSWNNSPNHDYQNALDGKTDTSFDYKDAFGGWVGLDLGEPEFISRIVYTPRNRDNFVRPGDKYELFYCGKDSWITLGEQESRSDSLVYKQAPAGVIFYLKNHTRGVEERIFKYEDEKQIWK